MNKKPERSLGNLLFALLWSHTIIFEDCQGFAVMLLIGRGIKREEMKYSVLTFFIVVLVTILSLTSSSNASTSTCSDATAAHLQTCLDQVERDESVLPGGPCSSSDWRCEFEKIKWSHEFISLTLTQISFLLYLQAFVPNNKV